MRKKSLYKWIRLNRETIDKIINANGGDNCIRNDEERRLWVMNDYQLYLWAKSEGVNV